MLRGDGNRASHPFTTHKDTHASVGIVLQLSTGIKKTEISRAVTVSYAFGLLAATAKSDRLLTTERGSNLQRKRSVITSDNWAAIGAAITTVITGVSPFLDGR